MSKALPNIAGPLTWTIGSESTTFDVDHSTGDSIRLEFTIDQSNPQEACRFLLFQFGDGKTYLSSGSSINRTFTFNSDGVTEVKIIGQPSFAGVTGFESNGPVIYDTLDFVGVLTDLEVLRLFNGSPTSEVQASAYPASLREVEVSEGNRGSNTDSLDQAPLSHMPAHIEIIKGAGPTGLYSELPAAVIELRAGGISGSTVSGTTSGNLIAVDSGADTRSFLQTGGLTLDVDGIIADQPRDSLQEWFWDSRGGSMSGAGKLLAYMTTMRTFNIRFQDMGSSWAGHPYSSTPPLHEAVEIVGVRLWNSDEVPTAFDRASALERLDLSKNYNVPGQNPSMPLHKLGTGFTEMVLGSDSPDTLQGVVYEGLWKHRTVLPSCSFDMWEIATPNDFPSSELSSVSEQAIYALAGLDTYHPDAPDAEDGIIDYHDVEHPTLYQYTVERLTDSELAISGDVTTFPAKWNSTDGAPDDSDYPRFQDGTYTYQDKDDNTATVPTGQFRLMLDDDTDLLFEVSAATYNSSDDRTEVTIESTPSQAWMASTLPSFIEGTIVGGTFIPRVDKQLL